MREQIAVSDKSGNLSMELKGGESKLSEKQNGSCCSVVALTLEELLQKLGIRKVDLLIVDVEGAELCVLRSFPWESASLGKIFCQLHPYAWKTFWVSGEDLKNFLSVREFRCFDIYFQEHDLFERNDYLGPSILIHCPQMS